MIRIKLFLVFFTIFLSSCSGIKFNDNQNTIIENHINDSMITMETGIENITTDYVTPNENELNTEETTEMKIWDFASKEDEITKIFAEHREDFKKIEKIITNNYIYFYADYSENKIIGGESRNTATDDVIEKDYIFDFLKKSGVAGIGKLEIGAVVISKIIFSIRFNDAQQGIEYIYEPEDNSYYDERNKKSMSILRPIEDNWFYFYLAPPDDPID